jgi:hypothetical protein
MQLTIMDDIQTSRFITFVRYRSDLALGKYCDARQQVSQPRPQYLFVAHLATDTVLARP